MELKSVTYIIYLRQFKEISRLINKLCTENYSPTQFLIVIMSCNIPGGKMAITCKKCRNTIILDSKMSKCRGTHYIHCSNRIDGQDVWKTSDSEKYDQILLLSTLGPVNWKLDRYVQMLYFTVPQIKYYYDPNANVRYKDP